MPEEWIVRVHGKEYGPVDAEELRSWRQDGRLIRENEVREASGDRWFPAGELPEVFADEPAEISESPPVVRRMSLGELFTASWRIYRQGFWRFFVLALLFSVPFCVLQIVAPLLQTPSAKEQLSVVVTGAAVAFLMLALLVVAWPFSLAGLQLLAADLFAGRDPGVRDLLGRAKPLWTRMFILGLTVYGSYFIWTTIPLLVALSLVSSGSGGAILLVLLLLIFVAYMVARLFINFLFWQQAGALGGGGSMEALRESKTLARSGRDRPRLERPLHRGALIAALWLLLVLVLNAALEIPALRLRGITTVEQLLPLLQATATNTGFDWIDALTTVVSSLFGAFLRGWLAAIFVVLYLDTKRSQAKAE